MVQANHGLAARRAMYKTSAANVAETIRDCEDLIYGVAAFREMGPAAKRVLAEVTQVAEVRRLQLSWELLEALMEGEGIDPEAVMAEVLDPDLHEVARFALLGEAA